MMFGRFGNKVHKSKFPQMHLPLDGAGAPTFSWQPKKLKIKVKGTKHYPVFYFNQDGSRYHRHENSFHVMHGTSKSWHPNGAISSIVENKNGRRHGQQIHWYPDGTLKRTWNWHYGEFHGRWMEWFENGVTSFQGHYRDGKKHGKWWEWYENGRMRVAGEFLDNYMLELRVWKPDGRICPDSGVSAGFGCWVHYNDEGEPVSRSEISNGEVLYDIEEEEF